MPEPDVEPAAHAARVGAGRPVRGRLEVERGEHLGRARLRRRLVHAVQAALDDELAAAGLGRVGRAALRHVADPLGGPPAGSRAQVDARDRRLAGGRRQQRRQHPQRRRLAGAVRAEEPEDLARVDA